MVREYFSRIVLACGLLVGQPVWAQTGSEAGEFAQLVRDETGNAEARQTATQTATQTAPLEADAIARWVASMADLLIWVKANEHRFDSSRFNIDHPRMNPMSPPSMLEMEKIRSPFSTAVAASYNAGVDGEITGLVARHGFTLDLWGETGDRISRAFIAMQMQGGPDMQARLDVTIAQMEENTQLSVALKNKLISSLMQTLDVYNLISDAPADDIAIVSEHQALIRQVLDPEETDLP